MNLLNLMEALDMHIRSKLTTSFYQFLLWNLLLPVYPLLAQRTFSVNANIQVLPPYSVYLSDYVSPGSDKLFVSLILNDVNEPSYPVKLKFQIEGQGIKIETKSLPATSILLTQGIQERLNSDELSYYFDPSNLNFEGLSLDQYIKNGALPEGIYKFSVQAFDGNRNIPVSNRASTTVWLILNDPPILNQSLCNAFVKVVYPQNIFFQWVPMHLNYPNAADNTEYNLRLVQVQPKGRNPNDAMNSSIPIFEINLKETSFFYGLSEPQLIPGQQYAWRVQALDTKKRNLFKNNGFSQVCTFTYGEACEQAQNLKVLVQNSQRVQISWDDASGAKAYKIRYRIKGFDSNSEWYEQDANSNTGAITSLKPNRKYEYQVVTVCDGVDNLLSSIDTFSTNISPQNKNCGKLYTRIEPDNTTMLASLNTNDLIMSDGFRIRITEAQGSNGQFSGSGVAYIPFINSYLKMNFTNINVNAKYEVFQGDIIAEKASLAKYAKNTSIPVNRDICQTASIDPPLAKENKPRDVKNKEVDTPTNATESIEKTPEKDVTIPKTTESKDKSGTGTSKIVANDNTPKVEPTSQTGAPNSNNTPSTPEVNTIASIVAEDLNSKGKRKAKTDETLYLVGKITDKREVKFTIANGLKNKNFSSKEVDWSTDYNIDDAKPKYNHGKLGKELVNDYKVYWPQAIHGVRKTNTVANVNSTSKAVNVVLVKEDIEKREIPLASITDGKFSTPLGKTIENVKKTIEKINEITDYIKLDKEKEPRKSEWKNKFDVKVTREFKNTEYVDKPTYYRERKDNGSVNWSISKDFSGPGIEWPPVIKLTYLESFAILKLGVSLTVSDIYKKDVNSSEYVQIPKAYQAKTFGGGDINAGVRGGLDLVAFKGEIRGEGSTQLGINYTYNMAQPEGRKNELQLFMTQDLKIEIVAEGTLDAGGYKWTGEEVIFEKVVIKKNEYFNGRWTF